MTGTRLLSDNTAFFHRWQQDPAHTSPGGETLQAVQGRAQPAVDQVRERAISGSVVVVSHTMTIAAILRAALGLDLGHLHHLRIGLASHGTFIFGRFGLFSLWRLVLLNDRHHLKGLS